MVVVRVKFKYETLLLLCHVLVSWHVGGNTQHCKSGCKNVSFSGLSGRENQVEPLYF